MTASGMEQPAVRDEAIHSIVAILLGWFETEGRQFIWRKTTDPFTVLIAEILLRKTQADVIEQFLPLFIAKYPAPAALASTPTEELTKALSPIGLSTQRANQLNEMAQMLVRERRGEVPSRPADLQLLPGVDAIQQG